MNRDVMKADDISLFLYLAAFIAECWKMLATVWEKLLLQKNPESNSFSLK